MRNENGKTKKATALIPCLRKLNLISSLDCECSETTMHLPTSCVFRSHVGWGIYLLLLLLSFFLACCDIHWLCLCFEATTLCNTHDSFRKWPCVENWANFLRSGWTRGTKNKMFPSWVNAKYQKTFIFRVQKYKDIHELGSAQWPTMQFLVSGGTKCPRWTRHLFV